MLIEYRNGKRKEVRDAAAKYLIKIGTARQVQPQYLTRDMADQPKTVKEPVVSRETEDGLDLLDKDALHALAKERGLKLHHMLGADKVRAALRGESQQ